MEPTTDDLEVHLWHDRGSLDGRMPVLCGHPVENGDQCIFYKNYQFLYDHIKDPWCIECVGILPVYMLGE